ncbi:hypothetical protein K504DRAFT_156122 [Pleomassaria siparia CBS 279.74]|uniref:Uncharacterized protein n=1 Tax=Pleomassaria siparia CBS 279.74 TaxID=1314801 RepID=A0A6G1KNR6_9PLEO|nr:hypothetical protein K504DRAFT_156122 [Pleomassaria siparia CBS 279.74]
MTVSKRKPLNVLYIVRSTYIRRGFQGEAASRQWRCRRTVIGLTGRLAHFWILTRPDQTRPHHTTPYLLRMYDYVPYHTVPYHTIPHHTTPYHVTQPHLTMSHNHTFVPHLTIPHNHTIPYHTTPLGHQEVLAITVSLRARRKTFSQQAVLSLIMYSRYLIINYSRRLTSTQTTVANSASSMCQAHPAVEMSSVTTDN